MAADRSAHGIDLHFPHETTLIVPRFFASGIDTIARRDLLDIAVTLCGFIPFGFFVGALVTYVTPIRRRRALAAALAIGFTLSFGIELTQAWIPSRSSSLLDLVLNVVDTGVGATVFGLVSHSKGLRLPR